MRNYRLHASDEMRIITDPAHESENANGTMARYFKSKQKARTGVQSNLALGKLTIQYNRALL